MFGFILKRLFAAVPLLLILSMISFFLIQVPPGDYADRLKSQAITMSGMSEKDAQIVADKYRETHGMNDPLPVQYMRWIGNIVTKGDFGDSYTYNKPISRLIMDRLPMTLLIALMCHFGSTVIGTMLGIYVATRQYSIADTVVTVIAFIGMTTPRFVLALVMLYLLVFHFNSTNVAALFSPEFAMADWSIAKFGNLLLHIWPVLLVAIFGGMAQNLRVMRSNMLDVMQMQYVETARAKGLSPMRVLFKHVVPNALHPMIMYQGVALPYMIAGELEIAIVFALPTVGPLIVQAMQDQDVFVVASFMLILATTLVIGNLIADITLALLDPRVRLS